MTMQVINKHKAGLVIALLGVAAVFVLFYRFYRHDARALADFSASYKKFEKAISDFSRPVFASSSEVPPNTDDLERHAEEALLELKTTASARLSSFTKNDAKLMGTTLEIADLSGKELDALKTYNRAAADNNTELDGLAKEFGDLTDKRQTAYARFKELAGLRD